MSSINRLKRELVFKVVFYGPGLGGKTTSLKHVHSATKAEHRGNLVSLATDTDRTLYFDLLPIKLMKLGDMVVKLQLYTVPGQVYYAATRKLVLSGADGVVFVADTQNARLDANLESLEDLNSNLAEQGRKLSAMPHVFQWNKRDLPDVTPLDELDRRLNLFSAPSIATVATSGDGVFDVLERATRLVVDAYRSDLPAPTGKGDGRPLFLDAEEVGLTDAIKQLADSMPSSSSSSSSRAARRAPVPSPAHTRATLTPSPSAVDEVFSLRGLWPSADRGAVQRAERALAEGDAPAAVAACEDLVSSVLTAGAELLGGPGQPHDSAFVALALLGVDGASYLAFRAVANGTLRGPAPASPSKKEALECYAFALSVRRALDRAVKL